MIVREVRGTVHRKGFRPMRVTVTTTLPDAQAYPAADVVSLRLERGWLNAITRRRVSRDKAARRSVTSSVLRGFHLRPESVLESELANPLTALRALGGRK